MILGHWRKKKIPKASDNNGGENIKENDIETKEESDRDSGILGARWYSDFLSSSLTEPQLDLQRAWFSRGVRDLWPQFR